MKLIHNRDADVVLLVSKMHGLRRAITIELSLPQIAMRRSSGLRKRRKVTVAEVPNLAAVNLGCTRNQSIHRRNAKAGAGKPPSEFSSLQRFSIR